MKMRKFPRKRSIITLILLLSFLLVSISGITLFAWPPKRIAEKINFSFLGSDHDFWSGLHIMMGFFMIVVVIFHAFINWEPLTRHVFTKNSETKTPHISKEVIIACLFIGFILFSAIGNFFPETMIISLHEWIRELWRAK